MMHDWYVQIQDLPAQFSKALYIYRKSPIGGTEILQGKEVVVYKPGEIPEPSLILQPDILQGLLEAIMSMGIKPRDAGKTEGLLEATEYHLEDLRQLLKLKPNIVNVQVHDKR